MTSPIFTNEKFRKVGFILSIIGTVLGFALTLLSLLYLLFYFYASSIYSSLHSSIDFTYEWLFFQIAIFFLIISPSSIYFFQKIRSKSYQTRRRMVVVGTVVSIVVSLFSLGAIIFALGYFVAKGTSFDREVGFYTILGNLFPLLFSIIILILFRIMKKGYFEERELPPSGEDSPFFVEAKEKE